MALLHGGRIARLGTPEEVVTAESLRETYGVEVDVLALPGAGGGRSVCVPRLPRPAAVSSTGDDRPAGRSRWG